MTTQAPWFLTEEPGKTVFVGDVLRIDHDGGAHYEVQNGGWASDGPNAPDTWLSESVLSRFEGKQVRVTIEVVCEQTRHEVRLQRRLDSD